MAALGLREMYFTAFYGNNKRADERFHNPPQGNQEPLVFKDKAERLQVNLGEQVYGMWYFPFRALTLLVG